MRTCKKCNVEQPLENFFRYAAGLHRHECRACALIRRRTYESPDYVPVKKRPAPDWRNPPPVNWTKLYHAGTRCWCCRRDSKGEMVCSECRRAA